MSTMINFLLDADPFFSGGLLTKYLQTLPKNERLAEVRRSTEATIIHQPLIAYYPELLDLLPKADGQVLIRELFDEVVSKRYIDSFSFDSLIPCLARLAKTERRTRLNQLLQWCLESRNLERAQQIADLLGRKLKRDEIVALHTREVEQGYFYRATETGELLDRKLTQEELLALFETVSREGGTSPVETGIEIASLLTEPERTDMLKVSLNRCLEYGMEPEAERVAELLGRELLNDEREKILACHVRYARVAHARATAGRCGRKLALAEIGCMVSVKINIGSMNEAVELIQELLRLAREECLLTCNTEALVSIANMQGEPVQESEFRNMLTNALVERDRDAAYRILSLAGPMFVK